MSFQSLKALLKNKEQKLTRMLPKIGSLKQEKKSMRIRTHNKSVQLATQIFNCMKKMNKNNKTANLNQKMNIISSNQQSDEKI